MYIKIHVTAGAKKESITEEKSRNNDGFIDHYTISVREPAERNLANTRILKIFRGIFHGKSVRLVSGHHSLSKILSVDEYEN